MAEEEWIDLLEVIYEESDFWEMDQEQMPELRRKAGYDEEAVEDLLDNLQKQGLVKREMEEIILTERGFEFISEKKTHEEQMLTQRLLLVFVTALALATLVDTVIKIGNSGNIYMNIVYSIVFAIIFLVLGMIARQNLR
jgi:DNA-binding MarR family transcriptional regulator